MNKIPEKIIAIDFDGTICELAYPKIGKLRKNVKYYINKLYNEGYGIVINTCRSGLFEADAINFLNKHNIKYHYINCNFPHLIEKYGQDCRKISADIYIDDKCLFNIPSWKKKYKLIKQHFKNKTR